MRIAIGSDDNTVITAYAVEYLEGKGHVVTRFGALAQSETGWAEMAKSVGRSVASRDADVGLVFCYTGTGVSIAANKVSGIRAALCVDAKTAWGARRWNDANVLALSLRLVTRSLFREIADAFLETDVDDIEREAIRRIETVD